MCYVRPRQRSSPLVAQPTLKILGTGTLADVLDDAVAFRMLEPLDRRLPGLGELRAPLGLAPTRIPRKVEPDYGRVVAEMLRGAARLRSGSTEFQRVVVIGDTAHNDGGALVSICRALGCPGAAFICDETDEEPVVGVDQREKGIEVHLANRWRLIERFEEALERDGFSIDEKTVVVIDIDKTALGARGRNHRPIDDARVAAVLRTAHDLRGDAVDEARLMTAYHHFNRPPFHPFTTDNQDYLAYLAFLVEGGWTTREKLHDAITNEILDSFEALLDAVSRAPGELMPTVFSAHQKVEAAVRAGDPTPFKSFRRAEFRETVDRMTPVGDARDIEVILSEKILLTAEVWEKAKRWRDRGALLFGLSDKPDEASFPTPELEAAGYPPLHRAKAFIVGEA